MESGKVGEGTRGLSEGREGGIGGVGGVFRAWDEWAVLGEAVI